MWFTNPQIVSLIQHIFSYFFSFFQYIIHTSMAPAKRRADDKIMKKPTLSNTEVSVSLHERLQLNTSNVSILILSSLDFFLVFAIFISAAETFKFFYFNKKRDTHARTYARTHVRTHARTHARAHDLFS